MHPKTLGEHLRNRRLEKGLRQEDVAAQLGTVREVYERWERDEREPVVSEWPGILAFLGYYPCRDETDADLVLKARRCQGAGQKEMATSLGVIPQKLRGWEHGEGWPSEAKFLLLKEIAAQIESINSPHALGFLQ